MSFRNSNRKLREAVGDRRPRHLWFGLTVLAAVSLAGCEKSESDAPDFEGLAKSVAVSESQISLHWGAAQDDRSHVDEIAYAIWIAGDGEVLDVDAPPQFVTGEGANSFCLTLLEADSEYQVLVRAEDRGGNQSENTEIHAVRTTATGGGMFVPEQIVAMDSETSSIVVGTIRTGAHRVIGAVSEDQIDWWERRDSSLWVESEDSSVDFTDRIMEAFLVRIRDKTYDDLFVLTDRGLVQMNNNGSARFSVVSDVFFPEMPQLNTLNFVHLDDDDHLDLTYANPLGRVVFYRGDWDGKLSSEGFYDLGALPQSLHVLDLDGDEGLDLILLSDLGIAVIPSEDDDYSFGPISWLGFPPGESGPFDCLLVADDDGDGDPDLHLYLRDETDHVTRLFRYPNNGEGEFDATEEVDFASAAYSHHPETADMNRDGYADVLFPQLESNNVVVYLGGDLPWSEVAHGLGGDDAPDWAWIGLLDSDDQDDVVFLSDESQSMSVLLTQHP